MNETKPKWGIWLDWNFGSFLLGANINIGKMDYWYGYICIYIGLWTLIIGRD